MQELKGTPPLNVKTDNHLRRDMNMNDSTISGSSSLSDSDDLASLFALYGFIIGLGVFLVPLATGSLVDAFSSFKLHQFFIAI